MIGPEGTFGYTFPVLEDSRSGSRRMEGTLIEPLARDQRRLLGHAPLLEAVEYQRETWQLYSRITLTPGDRATATARSFSFSVDRALIAMLRPNDLLHISRTPCGGLGLSVLREGALVAAAGAVSYVPLGADVSVETPGDLVEQAERIFKTRDPGYRMQPYPVELRIGDITRILHTGRPRIGPYEVIVRHGFTLGLPGVDSSVSIERRGICPDTAAHQTAELLETTTAELVP